MKIWFYIGSSAEYRPKIKYTVDLFFSIYGLKCEYLDSVKKDIKSLIANDDLLMVYDKMDRLEFFRELTKDNFDLFYLIDLFPEIYEGQFPPSFKNLKNKDTVEKIPILFDLPVEEKNGLYSIETKEGKTYSGITWQEDKNIEAVFYADLVASAFYLLSLREEVSSGKKDKHGRFKAEFSLRNEENLINYPLVNGYFKVIFDLIQKRFSKRNLPLMRKSFWPGGVPLAVVLTHDVDILDKWLGYAFFRGFQLLIKGRIKDFFLLLGKVFTSILKKKNPAHSFSLLMQVEKELNFGSTFFFLAGKPNLKSLLNTDVTYDITSERNRAILKKIKSDLHEVGLHGSYVSFSDENKMNEEKKLLENSLGDSINGIRQHFLRFDYPRTWHIQKNLGFLYDCSLGYPDASGFRTGLAFPFYPYDDFTDKIMKVLELNTNIMDQTYVKYKRQDLLKTKEEIFEILDRVGEYGGLVNLLWHTNVVDEFAFFGFMRTYQEILDYLQQKKAFAGSGKKIATWWQKRENLVQLSSSIPDKKIFEWEYLSGDFLDNATLELYFAGADKYHIRAEKVDLRAEIRKDFVLIELSGLKPNQKFKIFLQKKDE